MKDNRTLVILVLTSFFSITLIFVLPVVGFVTTMILLAVIPPWGRGLIERFAISAIVALSLIALVFPRASSVPINTLTAQVTLVAILLGSLALRLVPKWRYVPVSRPTLIEAMLAGLFAGTAGWIIGSYAGRNTYETVSGLYFSGWDNQGHFTVFANLTCRGVVPGQRSTEVKPGTSGTPHCTARCGR